MASEITHNIYQITYQLPESKHIKTRLLNMDEQQTELYQIILKNFQGVPMRKTGKGAIFFIISIKPGASVSASVKKLPGISCS
jgi:hypothetical protein